MFTELCADIDIAYGVTTSAMWTDTHCHLDAHEFGNDAGAIARSAKEQGVSRIVIPAIARDNFKTVVELAAQNDNCAYALGIHPIYVPHAAESDLDVLRDMAKAALGDPRFVAIGEIGLDFFIPALKENALREKQEHFYSEQLKIARDLDLPVLLHVRRSQDIILKYLRRIDTPGGIAHAFNGSHQQAKSFIDLGFRLGFGGAMTFPRALQIRRLAVEMRAESLVLETDAPDISPAWLHPQRNSPEQLPRLGEALAELRGMAPEELARITSANAEEAMPRLKIYR
jgi:TatD DNase family protein